MSILISDEVLQASKLSLSEFCQEVALHLSQRCHIEYCQLPFEIYKFKE
jgi:hypothetical protein